MANYEDRVFDEEEQWKREAQAVINDVKRHVREIKVSKKLRSNSQSIYFNLTTLEGRPYCIQLSARGFTIVGITHDSASSAGYEHFEILYSLLELISPQYTSSFGNALFDELNTL